MDIRARLRRGAAVGVVVLALCWSPTTAPQAQPPDVSALADRLHGEDVAERFRAVREIRRMGQAAAGARDALLELAEREKQFLAGAHEWSDAVSAAISVRQEIAFALVEIGAVEAGVDLAISELHGPDESQRNPDDDSAARALGRIGAPAVPALVARLEDPEASAPVDNVVDSLAWIGPDASAALPALAKVARSGRSRGAGEAMVRIGGPGPRTVSMLVSGLREAKDSRTADVYAWPLASIGGPEAAAALVAALQNPATRSAAVTTMRRAGPEAAEAVPILVGLLASGGGPEAAWAISAIGGEAARKAIPDLVALTEHSQPGTARAAFQALVSIDGAQAAVLDLAPRLLRREGFWASEVIERLGCSGPAAVPYLTDCLGDPTLRRAAAEALGQIGTDAAAAIPKLKEVATQVRDRDRVSVGYALARLGAYQDAADVMIGAVLSHDQDVRSYALSNVIYLAEDGFVAGDAVDVLLQYRHRFDNVLGVFSALGPKAAKALPELRQRLADAPDEERRVRVASTLASVGDTESALPALLSAFRWDDPTEDPPGLSSASAALGDLKPLPDGARTELERALDSRNRYVRDEAVLALCRGSSPNAKLAERVASVLDAPNEGSRRNAARALGDLGDPTAVPPLLRVLDDKYETFLVRCDAAKAMARLGETEHSLAFAAAHCRHPYHAILNRAIELLGFIAQHGGRAQAEPLLVELAGPGDDVDRHPERGAAKRELAVLRGEAPLYPHAADVSPVRSY